MVQPQTDPDRIIEELGGCGRFQIRLNIVVHTMKTIGCFSIISMVLMSKTPPWWCEDDVISNNMTSCFETQNGTEINTCPQEACSVNGTRCSKYGFGGTARTYVSEFGLVCDLDYVPSFIMTLQTAGTLAGNIIAGHMAEYYGRKKPFFSSIIMFITFNIIGFFSVNWLMFAVTRVFIGLAFGFFITVMYSLLSEFSLATWRIWVIGFPSWPIQGCFLALFGWLIQDWRYLQLFIGLTGIPLLFAWFIVPESFRWYVAHDKPEKAKQILTHVAAVNKKNVHDIEPFIKKPEEVQHKRKYSFLDLFKTRILLRISILLGYTWFTLGTCHYGMNFGIQALKGNVYLIMFLFFAFDIPTKSVGTWLQNRIGRRYTAMLCFSIIGAFGLAVGVVQSADVPNKDMLANIFALIAHAASSTVWGPVQTMTIELYPTVIRPIGFGVLSIAGRFGAMLGPQLVYLNYSAPGLMFFVVGALSFMSVLTCFALPETSDNNLDDKIEQTQDHYARKTNNLVKPV